MTAVVVFALIAAAAFCATKFVRCTLRARRLDRSSPEYAHLMVTRAYYNTALSLTALALATVNLLTSGAMS